MWKWLQKSRVVKNELFNFKNEPLTKFSIFLLIILDLFIFTNINIGIEEETFKAPKTYDHYTYNCSNHFKEVKSDYKEFSQNLYYEHNLLSPMCDTLYKKIKVFKEKEVFTKNYELVKDIEEKISTNNYRVEEISEKYNTRLFEQIAQISDNKLLLEVKLEYDKINKTNKELKKQLDSISKVDTFEGYKEYEKYVTTNKELFLIEKKSYEFWQPFKEYGYMLTFVIPLLLLFGFFYFKTKRKELKGENYNPIVKIISTHISFILTLPIIFYTLSLVYHVIPKTLLKKLIDFLTEIGLLSILNYLSIAIVVLIFGGLIYFVQKRTARLKEEKIHTKDYKKLISFSQCFVCEYKIDYTKNYCSFCGTTLHDTCKNCNEQTTFHEDYCKSCGVKKED